MCEICRQTPCSSRCPNYIPPTTYCNCYLCNDEIQIGEEYIESLNGNYAHLECCSLSGVLDTIKFLDIDIKIMEE